MLAAPIFIVILAALTAGAVNHYYRNAGFGGSTSFRSDRFIFICFGSARDMLVCDQELFEI